MQLVFSYDEVFKASWKLTSLESRCLWWNLAYKSKCRSSDWAVEWTISFDFSTVQIPRLIDATTAWSTRLLIAFPDASAKAYATAIYPCWENEDGFFSRQAFAKPFPTNFGCCPDGKSCDGQKVENGEFHGEERRQIWRSAGQEACSVWNRQCCEQGRPA